MKVKEAKNKIIVALDVDDPEMAIDLVKRLRPHVGMFKLGLEFITSTIESLVYEPEPNNWASAGAAKFTLNNLRALFHLAKGKIFWDGKFDDIPNTVAGASHGATRMHVAMFNIHCTAGRKAMEAARKAVDNLLIPGTSRPKILGVSLLTSLGYEDLIDMGFKDRCYPGAFSGEGLKERYKLDIQSIVRQLAHLAKDCGLDGVIASPQEITAIREECGPDFLIVTPGVRPEWAAVGDQKRVMTPAEAIKAGADYLVIGRPITKPPEEIGTPVDAAKRIAEEIASATE